MKQMCCIVEELNHFRLNYTKIKQNKSLIGNANFVCI